MEKIIVLSDKQGHSNWLAACIKTLFPECDVIAVLQNNKNANDNGNTSTDVKSAHAGLKTRILSVNG